MFLIFFIIIKRKMIGLKTKCLLLALLSFLVLTTSKLNPNLSFEEYCQEFGCAPPGKEYAKQKANFMKNYDMLLNKQKSGKHKFKISRFLVLDEEEVKKHMGLKKDTNLKTTQSPPSALKTTVGTSPATLDYRNILAVTDVRDQGGCGSCWAFSTTAVYESARILYDGINEDLSEQYAVQCDTGSSGCNGGWPAGTLQLLTANGIPSELQYPYKQQYDSYYGNAICTAPNKKKISYPTTSYNSYAQYLSVSQIQALLYAHGPMSVGVNAGNPDFMYTSGVVNNCANNPNYIDHVVLLVGYTETHWIIKNSWGAWWGDNGYVYVNKNSNWDCGVSNLVDYVVVNGPRFSPDNDVPVVNAVTINVNMQDSYGDGWQEIFTFYQNGVAVASFGANQFGNGFSKSTTLQVPAGAYTDLNVQFLGSWPQEVSFVATITVAGSTKTLYTLNLGQALALTNGQLLVSFTADGTIVLPSPPVEDNVAIQIHMMDSYGDGWEQVFAFYQNGVEVETFGGLAQFTGTSKIVKKFIPRGFTTEIRIKQKDNYPEEISFTAKFDGYSTPFYSLALGGVVNFAVGNILVTFVGLDCGVQGAQGVQGASRLSSSSSTVNEDGTSVITVPNEINVGLAIAVGILATIVVFLVIIIVRQVKKSKKTKMNVNIINPPVSAQEFSKGRQLDDMSNTVKSDRSG